MGVKEWVLEPVAPIFKIRLPLGGGQGTHLVFFPAQQQDDLGAAFQTWMGAHGAVRPEVRPGSLLT